MGELTPKLENIAEIAHTVSMALLLNSSVSDLRIPQDFPALGVWIFVLFLFSQFLSLGIVKEGLVYDILLSTPIIFTSHLINII